MLYRRILSLLCAFCVGACVFAGCAPSNDKYNTSSPPPNPGISEATETSQSVMEDPSSIAETPVAEKSVVRVGALKGPTGLGLLKLMADNESGSAANQYEFTLAGAPADIQTKLVAGELDIAALPTNLASLLYNKTGGQVEIVAVNTLGVLYLLTKGEELSSFGDLAGKTIYATGQGAVPEYVLNYLLEKHELTDKVTVEYKAEHAELVGLMAQGKAAVAVLPEPFVTSVLAKDPDIRVAFDLNQIWDNASGGMSLPMGCLVVRRDFLEQNKEALNKFLAEYKISTEYVNNNVDEAAALSGKYEIIPTEVAQTAIPKCNIVYLDGDEMKTQVSMFLNIIATANPQFVGGSEPDDAFYYKQ